MITISQQPYTMSITGNAMILSLHTDRDGALMEVRICNHALSDVYSTIVLQPDAAGNASIDIADIVSKHIQVIGYNASQLSQYIRLAGNALAYRVSVHERIGNTYYDTAQGDACYAIRGAISLSEQYRDAAGSNPASSLTDTFLTIYSSVRELVYGMAGHFYFYAINNHAIDIYLYKTSGSWENASLAKIAGSPQMKIYYGCIYELCIPASLVASADKYFVVIKINNSSTTLYISEQLTIIPETRYTSTLLLRNRFGAWDHLPMMLRTEDAYAETKLARVSTRAEADVRISVDMQFVSKYYTYSDMLVRNLLELSSATEMYLLRDGMSIPLRPKSLKLPIINGLQRNYATLQASCDPSDSTLLMPMPPVQNDLVGYMSDSDCGAVYAFTNSADLLPSSTKRMTARIDGHFIEFEPNNVFTFSNPMMVSTNMPTIIGRDMSNPYRFPIRFFTSGMHKLYANQSRSLFAGRYDSAPFPILYYKNTQLYPSAYYDSWGTNSLDADFPQLTKWASYGNSRLRDIHGQADLDVIFTPIVGLRDELGNSISCACDVNADVPVVNFRLAYRNPSTGMVIFRMQGDMGILSMSVATDDIVTLTYTDTDASTTDTVQAMLPGIVSDQKWNDIVLTFEPNNYPRITLYHQYEEYRSAATFDGLLDIADTYSTITFNPEPMSGRAETLQLSFFYITDTRYRFLALFSAHAVFDIIANNVGYITGTNDGLDWRAECPHKCGEAGYEIWQGNPAGTVLIPLTFTGESMSIGRTFDDLNACELVNTILPNSDVIDIRSGLSYKTSSQVLKDADTEYMFFTDTGMQRILTAEDLRLAYMSNVPYLRADTTQYTASRMMVRSS